MYDRYPEYISVAQRKERAAKKLKALRKDNPDIAPVTITGRSIAKSWWGKSWNDNLERYADYNYRLDRGRSYVRHGAVLDLQISPGVIKALVNGSEKKPYHSVIHIDPITQDAWRAMKKQCAGHIDSLGELLNGSFPENLKDVFFAKKTGLFPQPDDIRLECNCYDYATMCKHVAAAMYGVGARLDEDASLLFTLRGIDMHELVADTVQNASDTLLEAANAKQNNILDDSDLGNVFGIDLEAEPIIIPAFTQNKQKPTDNTLQSEDYPTAVDELLAKSTDVEDFSAADLEIYLPDWTRAKISSTLNRAYKQGKLSRIRHGVFTHI
ncbi:MAG: hypothetical protein AAF621_06165 [Pseudomonadota bacterium]